MPANDHALARAQAAAEHRAVGRTSDHTVTVVGDGQGGHLAGIADESGELCTVDHAPDANLCAVGRKKALTVGGHGKRRVAARLRLARQARMRALGQVPDDHGLVGMRVAC